MSDAAKMREYRSKNREQYNAYMRQWKTRRYAEKKKLIYDSYGGSCTCCGESNYGFLSIEHIFGVPGRHKRNGKRLPAWKMIDVIIREGFPNDITILCMNCNMAKHHYGRCPHETGLDYPDLLDKPESGV